MMHPQFGWERGHTKRRSVPEALLGLRPLASHLKGRFVLTFAETDHMPEQPVRRPLDEADLDDHFRPDPMDRKRCADRAF